jgi:hypothetical protein
MITDAEFQEWKAYRAASGRSASVSRLSSWAVEEVACAANQNQLPITASAPQATTRPPPATNVTPQANPSSPAGVPGPRKVKPIYAIALPPTPSPKAGGTMQQYYVSTANPPNVRGPAGNSPPVVDISHSSPAHLKQQSIQSSMQAAKRRGEFSRSGLSLKKYFVDWFRICFMVHILRYKILFTNLNHCQLRGSSLSRNIGLFV